jgi:RNA polymerase sigma-70 factor (ECF subfamily)
MGTNRLRKTDRPGDARDATAFEGIVREHYALIVSFAAALLGDRAEAEDLAQEVFIVAYRRMREFDATRPAGPWLCGIARRLALNASRKRRPVLYLDDERLGWLERTCVRSGRQPGGTRQAALDECLALLEEGERRIIELRYREGRSCEEIGTRLETGPAGVTKRLYRIRRKLADCVTRRLGGGHE